MKYFVADRRSLRLRPIAAIMALLLVLSCKNREVNRFPDKSWLMYAEPEEAGWSSEDLQDADRYADSIKTSSYMLIHKGAVVHTYGDVARRYRCHSIRKSILSALYGIYEEAGVINLDEDMESIGINRVDSLMGYELKVRVRSLLSSSSGIYHPGASETKSMMANRPERLSHPENAPFYYNNWDFNTLGTIFRLKTGEDIFDAFMHRIAEPLQMQDFRLKDGFYEVDPAHSGSPEYKFKLSSRDMARFGLLFLENGRWKDRQIVPAAWVKESTSKKVDVDERCGISGFGYCWWTMGPPFDKWNTFLASGFHGHRLVIVPELDIVFVHRVNTYAPDIAENEQIFALFQKLLDARSGDPERSPALMSLPDNTEEPVFAGEVLDCEEIAGDYVSPGGEELILTCEHGELWMQDKLAGNFRLLPVDSATFLVEDILKEMTLMKDPETGDITLLYETIFRPADNPVSVLKRKD